MRISFSMKTLALAAAALSFIVTNSASAWSQNTGSGTLGLGTIRVLGDGKVTIYYSVKRGKPGAELREGVQIHIYPWNQVSTERTYFKLKSEFMVASSVDEKAHEGELTAALKPGLYVLAFGQWHGISHDNPNDPYFDIQIDGPAEFVSRWAGDVSIYNPAGRPPIPGQWGSIGKISAFWSQVSAKDFGFTEIFPGAKVVTGFGNDAYKGK